MAKLALKFITGNKGKFAEVAPVLAPIKIKQLKIDLEEIQELDPKLVIKHKLGEAFKYCRGEFFIEDTSTYYNALGNKLPGTLMKWFLQILGTGGLYKLAKKLGDTKAEMHTIIAYTKNRKQIYFFEGRTKGSIVAPIGTGGFGLDTVFKPSGSLKTLAQLKQAGATKFSPRTKAALKFKKFLLTQDS